MQIYEVWLQNNRTVAVTEKQQKLNRRTSLDDIAWCLPHTLLDRQGHASLSLAVAFALSELPACDTSTNNKYLHGEMA